MGLGIALIAALFSRARLPYNPPMRPRLWELSLCFFVSGATSLMLEVAWSKELSYLLGNSLHGVSTVVAAFMAGLALGSILASRVLSRVSSPVRAYGLFQLTIGVYAMLSLPAFRALEPGLRSLFRAVGVASVLGIALRFASVFVLLALPVLLMGMTLPLLARAATSPDEKLVRSGGLLYGANTIGACVGTMLAGYALVPSLGLLRTTWVAGALDLATGAAALLWIARAATSTGAANAAMRPALRWRPWQVMLAVLFGCSGAIAMLYEVAWFRLLGLTLGPSVYAFSCMLAVYLAGIGLGSAIAAPLIARTRIDAVRVFAMLQCVLAVLGLGGLFVASRLPELHLALQAKLLPSLGTTGFALGQAMVAALLVFVPCLVSGALFPAALRAIERAPESEASSEGAPASAIARLYFGNTIGSIVGSLGAGFVLVPRFGLWHTIQIAGIASAVVGGLAFVLETIVRDDREGALHRASGRSTRTRLLAVTPILVAVGLALVAPRFDRVLWNRGLYRDAVTANGGAALKASPGELLFAREGLNASVAVFRVGGGATLYVSGKPDASTNRGDTPTQLLLGHLPVMLAPFPRDVLVIGYGSGMTVGAVLAHDDVRSVDVLELEPAVIDASPYFESINRRPLADPRCSLVVEDGRLHLEESRARYDVITSEPSNPWMAGIANLFTTDFYREVRGHLKPHGLFAQWIQNYRISDEAFQTILASLHAEFPFVLVFQVNLGDFMVLASDEPISLPWSELERRFAEPAVARTLAEIGVRSPLDLGFFLLLPQEESARYASGARLRNTDDNVWLEHRMPIELVRSALDEGPDGDLSTQLAGLGATHRLAALERLLPGWPLEAGIEAMLLFPNRVEPLTVGGDWLFDPWRDVREAQLGGLRAELEARGRADLVARVDVWAREAEALRELREGASRGLVAAKGDGTLTDAMLDQTLALVELPIALTFRASRAHAAGDAPAAERFYTRALAHPESDSYLDALLGLARLYRDHDQVDRGLSLAREATERFPYYAATFVLASKLAARRGDPAGARELVERGLFYNPGDRSLLELAGATRQ